MSKFPHLEDTQFPDVDGVDVWKYKNEFDYSKYDKTQMRITVCRVPWDVGLIHVGNAQIGGLGNVVDFETIEARDSWLDAVEPKFSWQTKYREYHTNGYIEVPLPYETCVNYNYVWVEYNLLPVDYAQGGKTRFFFFIRKCESLSPSTCKVEILRDSWQTFIYDVDIAYMMLERGHAPMSVTTADEYLSNPIEKCNYLLAEDVNFGDSYVSRVAGNAIVNSGDMYACIVSSADISQWWGSLTDYTAWTPDGRNMPSGQPGFWAYAIYPEDLSGFLDTVEQETPHFLQTIQCVFFIKRDFVSIGRSVEFCGHVLVYIDQSGGQLDLVDLNKQLFGYGADYQDIAKLYTYPYAYLEIADDSGNVSRVKVEETSGNLALNVTTSLAYPWIAIDGRISGIGTGEGEITFYNADPHRFDFDGEWYNYLKRWNIPTFGVNVAYTTVYDYETVYQRRQRENEIENAYGIAVKNADTAMQNADDNARTAYENALANADAAKDNADDTDTRAHDNAIASINNTKTNADARDLAAKQNADDSATTANANAIRSADAAKENADRSALAAHDTAVNSANTDKSNADLSALTVKDNSTDYANATKTNTDSANDMEWVNARRNINGTRSQFSYHRSLARRYMELLLTDNEVQPGYSGFIGASTWWNISKLSDDWDADWYLQNMSVQTEVNQISASSVTNGVSNAVSTTVGGALVGAAAGPGGAAIGAVVGMVGGGVSIASSIASLGIQVQTTQMGLDHMLNYGDDKTNNAIAYARNMMNSQKTYEDHKFYAEDYWLTQAADSVQAVGLASADLVKERSDAIAALVQTTELGNINRSYNAATTANAAANATAIGNADTVYDANVDNASKSQTTSKDNANATKNTAIGNAQRTYDTETASNTRDQSTNKTNADNLLATQLDVNQRTFDTAISVAERTLLNAMAINERVNALAKENALKDKTIALEAIDADILQAGLKAPVQFGRFADGETSVTRPQGVFCNVVTQNKDAIEQAGDYFLRYGYACNRSWKFVKFNLMKHFTYWKCSDIWIHSNNVPDAYTDELRFFLIGGVCVWRRPEDIGAVSIYDN